MDNESFFHAAQLLVNLISERKQKAIERGEFYNVFEVLNLSTDEVRLHSAFIADLLNPKGKHGLGIKPLQEFIRILHIDTEFDENALWNCHVRREYHIGNLTEDKTSGGNIDILLIIDNYLIVIENKIQADDQPRQLRRYYNFVESHPHKLVYLTLYGNQPSEDSACGLECDKHFMCLSYKTDITRWIEHCLIMAISKPLIRETLQQYLNIIMTITDTIMEENYKTQLYTLMDKCPDVVPTIRKEEWGYRQHLVLTYIITPFKEWCNQNGYRCQVGPEFENQDSGVWFGIALTDQNKYIAVKFNRRDYTDAVYGIGMPDINDPYTLHIPNMTAFEQYRSWSVDIAKDIIHMEVFNYVCEKIEQMIKVMATNTKTLL